MVRVRRPSRLFARYRAFAARARGLPVVACRAHFRGIRGCMGIKAATVRTLLQRACRKAGVSDSAAFIGAFTCDDSPSLSSCAQNAPSSAYTSEGRCAMRFRLLFVISASAFGLLCFVPADIEYVDWGIGRELVYGVGFGSVLGALISLAEGAVGCGGGTLAYAKRLAMTCAMVVSGVATAVFSLAVREGALVSPAFQVSAFFSSAIWIALAASAAIRLLGPRGSRESRDVRFAVASVAVAAVFTCAGFLVPGVRMVVAGAATVLGGVCVLRLDACSAALSSDSEMRASSSFAAACALLAAFSALFWEECWRAQGYASFVDWSAAFFFIAACFALWAFRLRRAYAMAVPP